MENSLKTLSDHVRSAGASATPLRIRGGGSKDFYGHALVGDVLETSEHTGIVSYEPSELVITAKAGTPLAEVEAALAEKGQCLAFEPPSFGAGFGAGFGLDASTQPTGVAPSGKLGGTVGGMVAAGLSGPARASVGAVRDYVLGVELLNAQGDALRFGGTVMKNVAGYDVSRLMAGSWGTLGVITEVSLKVLPVTPAEATLVFDMPQAKALEQLNHWGGDPLPLNASCWVKDRFGADLRELLFVRLRGAVAAVQAASAKMRAQCGGSVMDNAQAQPDWALCRDLNLPFFAEKMPQWASSEPKSNAENTQSGLCLWRISLPQTAPPLDLPHAQLIEWHGAQRWLWAGAADALSIHAAALAANGYATCFIAENDHNTLTFGKFSQLSPSVMHVHRQLKAQLDPQGIFNRNRLFSEF
jgi:glycolate oxidase FAD binding subunit